MPSQHISICPISTDGLDGLYMPLKLADALSVEDVSEILSGSTFDPLVDMFYSKSEAEALKSSRYALVYRCALEDYEGREWREKSEALLYELYLGLKVIRPTAGRFQVLHYDTSEPKPWLPRGTRNDYATILSDCERLNWPFIRSKDVEELAKTSGVILDVLRDAKNPIAQAVQSLEIGYRGDFLNVRHLLWVVGLDALFTSTEWENQGKIIAAKRVTEFLGPDFPIYPEKADLGYAAGPKLPNLTLSEAIGDVYELRNVFAHGAWPDKQWAGQVSRRCADDVRDVYYAEVLSEAASSILRGCLRAIFSDRKLVELFSNKTKMNDYFKSRGLVREKNKKRSRPP